ncbi:MAG: YlxR family protein [Cyanobacteriota bacterium]|nr:YlxR family protein [Cyanobacteriota bacterium]
MRCRAVQRRCVSCRELFDRTQLWRVIRLADGGVALDQGMGRSAYLCRNRSCLDDARRKKKLQRALRCQVADSIVEALEQRLANGGASGSEAR